MRKLSAKEIHRVVAAGNCEVVMQPASGVIKTSGLHVICELSGCDRVKLADAATIEKEILAAAAAAKALVLHGYVHQFTPTGVTGLLCLAESHLSIHTWPEIGYAAVDIYTCGDNALPEKAVEHLAAALNATRTSRVTLLRGVPAHLPGHFVCTLADEVVPPPPSAPAPTLTAPTPAPLPQARKRYKPQPVD